MPRSGSTRATPQLAAICDAYPVWPLVPLDGPGLCGGERAGAFAAAGEPSPGGSLPMTTNGGMLSPGHTGVGAGTAVLVEGVRQIKGKAGQRQVADLVNAVETASVGSGSLKRASRSPVAPGRCPASRSSCHTHLRSISAEQPNVEMIEQVTSGCEAGPGGDPDPYP